MKRFLSVLLCIVLASVSAAAGFAAPFAAETDLVSAVEAAYKGAKAHKTDGEKLLSDPKFLANAGNTGTDWTALALARFTDAEGRLIDEDYDAYADRLEAVLDARLAEGLTASTKYADLYRMLLTLGALGRVRSSDIAAVTAEAPVKLSRLNVMTLSYALIVGGDFGGTLPAKEWVKMLLTRRHADGGWTLTAAAPSSDPDVTAAALTALAAFRDDETVYDIGGTTLTAAAAIDAGLDRLSQMQQADGGFVSYGMKNCESVSQVIVALTSLGIDPTADARFVKNGRTPVDALMSFCLSDGTFAHAFETDPGNPAAEAGAYNAMATDQAKLALTALYRFLKGETSVYDYTPVRVPQSFLAVLRRIFDLLRAVLRLTGGIIR
ncbi:MAG: hypothetical protein IK104_04310 [Clostridia bacterium]|nr:hypothetical protein [Clostridia bacterium]